MTADMPSASRPEERIEALDVLRGVALFGVLIVNLVNEFRVSIFEQFLRPAAPSLADQVIQGLIRHGLELKALALFSFLFGVGLALQHERLARTGNAAYWLARRMAALLGFGLVHLLLIWNGDILTEYAIAGFLVLPLLVAPNWVLAFAAAALFAFYLAAPNVIPFPDPAWIRDHVAVANRVYATGDFIEIRAFSLQEIPALGLLHAHVAARTLALFLLGALAWRTEVVGRRHLLPLIAAVGVIVGGALTVPGAQETSVRIGQVLLALGVGSGVLLFAHRLRLFAPIGRMAFSNYLLQSLILGWIFYGYGLGLFGRLGIAEAFALGLALYAVQVAFSIWWLKRFRFGPVEWLWRTLMYGKRQPWI